MENSPLKEKYPCLYKIDRYRNNIVADDVSTTSYLNISWRRDLIEPILATWNKLLLGIANFKFAQRHDVSFEHEPKGTALGEITLLSSD